MYKYFANRRLIRATASLATLTLASSLILTLAVLGPIAAADANASRSPDPRGIALIDQRGAPFALRDLRGVPVIVTFIATRCLDACPIANALFARLRSRLDHDHTAATLLTVTLDPAYDTPFVMAREAHVFAARVPGWRFATSSPDAIRALMRAFGVDVRPDRRGVPDVHTTFVYVLDARSRLARTLLLSTTLVDEAAELLRDPALRSV
jgi:cytochrome oxidase Cu insertion factor (SCO1/SenC/PrrC family)